VLAAFVMVDLCWLLCLVGVGIVSGIEEIGHVRQVTRRVKEPGVHVCCRE
jgi:hypothetical protein